MGSLPDNSIAGHTAATFCGGHVGLAAAQEIKHLACGAIGLPLLAKLQTRRHEVAELLEKARRSFCAHLRQVPALAAWAACIVARHRLLARAVTASPNGREPKGVGGASPVFSRANRGSSSTAPF